MERRSSVGVMLLVALLPQPAFAPTWQYFCHRSAAEFASAATTSVISILPDAASPSSTLRSAAESYQATLPAKAEAAESASSASSEAAELMSAQQVGPRLEQHLRGTCYFMRSGFWTYEVCPWNSVRQYHSESSGRGGRGGRGSTAGAATATTSEHSLGSHASALDEYDASQNIYSQRFTAGTDGRSTLVRFLCPESWRDEDGIVLVHEPNPKEYVVNLRVHALCETAGGLSPGSAAKRAAPVTEAGKAVAAEAAAAAAAKAKAAAAASAVAKGAAKKQPAAAADASSSSSSGSVQIAEMILPNMRLLSALRGRCFSIVIDYWTYEFCPQQHMRQFRQDGNRVGVEFNLGKYERAGDKVTVGVRGGSIDRETDLVPHTFAQTYVNGTANRRTQLRVRCASKNEHTIVGVEEPRMHEYVVIFSSPLGCELSCAYAAVPPAEVGSGNGASDGATEVHQVVEDIEP